MNKREIVNSLDEKVKAIDSSLEVVGDSDLTLILKDKGLSLAWFYRYHFDEFDTLGNVGDAVMLKLVGCEMVDNHTTKKLINDLNFEALKVFYKEGLRLLKELNENRKYKEDIINTLNDKVCRVNNRFSVGTDEEFEDLCLYDDRGDALASFRNFYQGWFYTEYQLKYDLEEFVQGENEDLLNKLLVARYFYKEGKSLLERVYDE